MTARLLPWGVSLAACLTGAAGALDFDRGQAARDASAIAEYLGGASRPPAVPPAAPAAEDLPAELPADILDRDGFIRFRELGDGEARRLRNLPENLPDGWPAGRPRHYAPAPIGGSTFFDEERVLPGDGARLRAVFDPDNAFAMIPPGAAIQVSRDSRGREVWEYPPGATVAHLILLKTDPARVYELRIVRKMADGRWAFGSYSPPDLRDPVASPRLVRNAYEGQPVHAFAVRPAAGGRDLRVRITRIRLSSCQGCHFMNSTADYQYERRAPDGSLDVGASVRASGPCGFVPNNPSVRSEWAVEHLRRHGRSPFQP